MTVHKNDATSPVL